MEKNKKGTIIAIILCFILPPVGLVLSIIDFKKSKKIINIIGLIISSLLTVVLGILIYLQTNHIKKIEGSTKQCELAYGCKIQKNGKYLCTSKSNSVNIGEDFYCSKDIIESKKIWFYPDDFNNTTKKYIISSINNTLPSQNSNIHYYVCQSDDCKVFYNQYESEQYAVIYDNNKYYIFNINADKSELLNINNDTFIIQDIGIIYNSENKPMLLKIFNKDNNFNIYDIVNKNIIDTKGMKEISISNDGKYLLLSDYYKRGILIELSNHKIIKEFKSLDLETIGLDEYIYSYGILENNSQKYVLGIASCRATCRSSLQKIYTIDGKEIYEFNNIKSYSGADIILNNKNLIIIENDKKFKIYTNNKLNYSSKEYDYISIIDATWYDIIDDFVAFYDNNVSNNKLLVKDNHNINIIDYQEKIIANIMTINDEMYIYTINLNRNKDTKKVESIELNIVDKKMTIKDFTAEDLEELDFDVEENVPYLYGYKYTYDIATKKISKKSKQIYYDVEP